jgi:hypothetical protein
VVIEDAFSGRDVERLRDETVQICRGERGSIRNWVPSEPSESDDDVISKFLCIHFPHKISDVMRDTITHETTVEALTRVIGPNVKCMQSMLFIKSAGKPGQAWHQDEYYIPTRDRSLTGGWIALDDATVENGCLWVIPGSHKPGVLWPQRDHGQVGRFDCSGESYAYPYSDEDAVPVEMKAGSIVIFNGYLLHRSLPNRTEGGFRRSLVNHFMSAESLLPWHSDTSGWLGQVDYRDIVMVAGVDPYAYKGIEDRVTPHVRASGEGGCAPESRKEEGEGER